MRALAKVGTGPKGRAMDRWAHMLLDVDMDSDGHRQLWVIDGTGKRHRARVVHVVAGEEELVMDWKAAGKSSEYRVGRESESICS